MTATPKQVQAAFSVMRAAINATGWGGWVSDAKIQPTALKAANAVKGAPSDAGAVLKILRDDINATGFGGWVTDAQLMPEATAVVAAVVAAGPKPSEHSAPVSTPPASSGKQTEANNGE